jgi:hypothetical protein
MIAIKGGKAASIMVNGSKRVMTGWDYAVSGSKRSELADSCGPNTMRSTIL